jgi:sigma-B regulation protein RsbU (phosphoserine phosphatase)
MGIGLANEPVFSNSTEEITLKPQSGDLFVFFTDGVVEAMDSHYSTFGEDNLTSIICKNADKSAQELQNIIINAVKNFSYSSPVQDDLTLIVMKAF